MNIATQAKGCAFIIKLAPAAGRLPSLAVALNDTRKVLGTEFSISDFTVGTVA
jgi:hypothetical protein